MANTILTNVKIGYLQTLQADTSWPNDVAHLYSKLIKVMFDYRVDLIAEVDKIAGHQSSACSIAFKHYVGLTPKQFQCKHRIGLGKLLLSETNELISQIAFTVGMSPNSFDNLFTKYTGVNPTEYRNGSC